MASKIKKFFREFVSEEKRNFKISLGTTMASSLAGIVAGVILASIVWSISLVYFFDSIEKICTK
ncbi:MAG: hypothetical protein WCK10_01185 [Candidatus Staskawiczbacteria bacterium]